MTSSPSLESTPAIFQSDLPKDAHFVTHFVGTNRGTFLSDSLFLFTTGRHFYTFILPKQSLHKSESCLRPVQLDISFSQLAHPGLDRLSLDIDPITTLTSSYPTLTNDGLVSIVAASEQNTLLFLSAKVEDDQIVNLDMFSPTQTTYQPSQIMCDVACVGRDSFSRRPLPGQPWVAVASLDTQTITIYEGTQRISEIHLPGRPIGVHFLEPGQSFHAILPHHILEFHRRGQEWQLVGRRQVTQAHSSILCSRVGRNTSTPTLMFGTNQRSLLVYSHTSTVHLKDPAVWRKCSKHEPILIRSIDDDHVLVCGLSNEVLVGQPMKGGLEGSRHDYGFRGDSPWLCADVYNDTFVGITDTKVFVCHNVSLLYRVTAEKGAEFEKDKERTHIDTK
eukprot:gnl/Dysnectes_brevis/4401_a5894_773.p1 GENE.gnl/Dysnectes_brevis/4401_a5894_773~~gnl/Dysnectes_brevis/4401_a5894_773.p1  ORF type:complete len:391 (+),score=-20.52 gnl/Dysnectes_brevis/4401_a5894_773:159-1331(+)